MLKPRSTPTRELVDLDGLWRFGVAGRVQEEPWTGRLDTPLEAAVPASYNDLFTDPSIRDHVGLAWYQRTARVPRGWAGERVLLRFDAATHEGRVYVDHHLVAEHVGGYTPFEADITDVVRAGEEFRLTVGVNNELTNMTMPPGTITVAQDGRRQQTYHHDFYNYAGLARSVWLYSRPATHVADVTIVTGVEGAAGIVDYVVRTSAPADVRVRALDATGAEVATATGAQGGLRIEDVTLWQPGAAYLYDLVVEVVDRETVVDSYTEPFGVRTVEVRGTEFLINGEPFYFTGFGKHEDSPVRGKGHDDAYLVHDFQLMEWVGANSFRTSHYPYAEEVLEFADRHGIVVIDETAAVGINLAVSGGLLGAPPKPTFSPETFNDQTQAVHGQHLRELIARDKNHPSVVMWCISNEPSSSEEGAREYFEPLVRLARELDPTRPLTYTVWLLAHGGDRPDRWPLRRHRPQPVLRLVHRHRRPRHRRGPLGAGPAGMGREVRQAALHGRVRRGHHAGPALGLGHPVDRGVPAGLPRHEPPGLRPDRGPRRRARLELCRLPDIQGHPPGRREQEGRVHA